MKALEEPEHARLRRCSTNFRDVMKNPMTLAKVWYFFNAGSTVALAPYLPLYFSGLGLSATQLGGLALARTWAGAASSLALPALADRLGVHKVLMVGCWLAAAGLRLGAWWPAAPAAAAALVLAADCCASPAGVLADAAVVAAARRDGDYGRQRTWASLSWGITSVAVGLLIGHYGMAAGFYSSAALAVPAALVALAFPHHHLRTSHSRSHHPYRHSRMSSVRVASSALLDAPNMGDVKDVLSSRQPRLDRSSVRDLEAPLLLDSGAAVSHADVVHALGRSARSHRHHMGADTLRSSAGAETASRASPPPSYWARVRLLLHTGAVTVFLLRVVVAGAASGVIGSYTFLFLRDRMGATPLLLGLTLATNCVAEAPAFQLQGALLARVSPSAALHTALGTAALRLALYAVLPLAGSAWAVLPIELLHGITFGVCWGACCAMSKRLAPPGLEATMQGVVSSAFTGVGAGLGGLGGGLLWERHGGQAMFLAASLAVLAGWFLTVVLQLLLLPPPLAWIRSRQQRPNAPEAPKEAEVVGKLLEGGGGTWRVVAASEGVPSAVPSLLLPRLQASEGGAGWVKSSGMAPSMLTRDSFVSSAFVSRLTSATSYGGSAAVAAAADAGDMAALEEAITLALGAKVPDEDTYFEEGEEGEEDEDVDNHAAEGSGLDEEDEGGLLNIGDAEALVASQELDPDV